MSGFSLYGPRGPVVKSLFHFTGQYGIWLCMYFVYLLENQDDKSWYIGFTSDLKRRILEHQNGQGGRTTKLKKHWRLIYSESYVNEQDAKGREVFLKSGSGRRFLKKQLVNYLSA